MNTADSTADFYGRKSNNDDGRSVEGQEDEYLEDCEAEGFAVGRRFADPDRSASRYSRQPRPDFNALVEHIEAGNCQILSMWEPSRGSRRLGQWIDFLDLCRKQKVLIRIISHGRTYDISVRRDWRTLADDGVDAADESEKISERTRRGKRKAARQGRPVGRLAFGWQRVFDERGKFVEQVPHPEQGPIVQEIFARVADGEPFAIIAESLNKRKVPAPQRPCPDTCKRDHRHFAAGAPWTDRQVRVLTTHASYAGRRIHQGHDVGEGVWEPLVEPEVWQAVQARLTARNGLHNDVRLSHWLAGVILCGACEQQRLHAGVRGKGNYAYQCRKAGCYKTSGSARGLEGFIEPLILGRLGQPDAAPVFQPANDSAAIKQAKAEEKELREQLDGYYKAAGRRGAGITPTGLAAIEREMLPQIEAAAAKVRRLSTPAALAKYADVDLVAKWPDMDARPRREIVVALVDLVLEPGSKGGGPKFDPSRLGRSRWVGDPLTWGERWAGSTGPSSN